MQLKKDFAISLFKTLDKQIFVSPKKNSWK